MQDFNNKVYIVTGGSKGIGFATAQALVKRGAKVAIFARGRQRLDAAVKELGSNALGVSVDIGKRDEVFDAFAQVKKHFGRLDGCVNNAGMGWAQRLELTGEADIRRLVDINFIGLLFCCQAAVPLLRENGGGRIVNLSSATVRHDNEFAHMGLYSATKAAVDKLTAELREEVKRDDIGVTLFSPGAVYTGSIENYDPQAAAEAMQAWLAKGPECDGAITDVSLVGEAIVHCLGYPPGMAIDFMELRPNVPTAKVMENEAQS